MLSPQVRERRQKNQASILPASKDLFYVVTWISDDGLTFALDRSGGRNTRRIHVNDTMLIH